MAFTGRRFASSGLLRTQGSSSWITLAPAFCKSSASALTASEGHRQLFVVLVEFVASLLAHRERTRQRDLCGAVRRRLRRLPTSHPQKKTGVWKGPANKPAGPENSRNLDEGSIVPLACPGRQQVGMTKYNVCIDVL